MNGIVIQRASPIPGSLALRGRLHRLPSRVRVLRVSARAARRDERDDRGHGGPRVRHVRGHRRLLSARASTAHPEDPGAGQWGFEASNKALSDEQ